MSGLSEAAENKVVDSVLEETKPRREWKRANYLPAPHFFALNQACDFLNRALGGFGCYLVGSSLERRDYRDVDVRFILPDEEFDWMFRVRPGDAESGVGGWLNPLWSLMCLSISVWLREQTKLPIDFQIQRQTQANEKHSGTRSALGIFLDYPGERPSDVMTKPTATVLAVENETPPMSRDEQAHTLGYRDAAHAEAEHRRAGEACSSEPVACTECPSVGLAHHELTGDVTRSCPVYVKYRNAPRTKEAPRTACYRCGHGLLESEIDVVAGVGPRCADREGCKRRLGSGRRTNDANVHYVEPWVVSLVQSAATMAEKSLQRVTSDELRALRRAVDGVPTITPTLQRLRPETPVPIVLTCPLCKQQHVDEGEWMTRAHRTHRCVYGPFGKGCGHEWQPSNVATVGVRYEDLAAQTGSGGAT